MKKKSLASLVPEVVERGSDSARSQMTMSHHNRADETWVRPNNIRCYVDFIKEELA